jgi:hypothetical protein
MALMTAIVARSASAAAAPYAGAVSSQIRVAAPAPVALRSQLRTPSRDEMLQFHAEFLRAGWEGAQLAAICTGYARAGGTVKPTGTQFATLFTDLDGDRRPEWVVGAYFPTRATTGSQGSSAMGGRGMVTTRDDRARVVVFQKPSTGPWRIDWISPGLGYEFRAPEHNLREVAEGLGQIEHLRPPLSITDIDGDRRPDIIYQCWSESPVVGALPGIYRFDGTRWVGVAPQADRFSLQDVDADGTLEVVTGSRYVGYGSGDDDVPRVWRWTGRQYHEASSEFPKFYAGLTAKYRSYVQRKEQKGETFDRASWERAIRKATSLAG